MLTPLFLKPVFQYRIWGGTELHNQFGYNIPYENTGECWAISAHPNGPSVIGNGHFEGMTLDKLWREHPELFGYPKEAVFPLLTKILDAKVDLSVQVHPDDNYAQIHENGELGKTECWYIIDCKEDAEIIIGHNAKTKEEFVQQVQAGNWDELLRKVKIKPGDFFYIPSGTIHAIGAGTLILETQQSSDTTYRVYDYDRKDTDGKLRELHLDKAIDVTAIPHQDISSSPIVESRGNVVMTTYVKSDYFTVYKWDCNGKSSFSFNDKYQLLSVIKGEARLNHSGKSYDLSKGTHFIIPYGFGEFEIEGTCEIIVSHT